MLDELLAWLDATRPCTTVDHAGWQIVPVSGGMNNLLYRITTGECDLAVKFTRSDARDRAGREFATLTALYELGLDIAPKAVLLDRGTYANPVVVQTWLQGFVSESPPNDEEEWSRLAEHYAAVHRINAERVKHPLPAAVLTMYTAAEGRQRIREQLASVPNTDVRPEERELVARLDRTPLPDWPAPTPVLCRCDPTMRNFIRRPEGWCSVDWEYSGWGNPAFEIADLTTHPAYRSVSESRWDWLIETHGALIHDPGLPVRVGVYRLISNVWWVARLARSLHEVPRGQDERLAARSLDWEDVTRSNLRHYLGCARHLLDLRDR